MKKNLRKILKVSDFTWKPSIDHIKSIFLKERVLEVLKRNQGFRGILGISRDIRGSRDIFGFKGYQGFKEYQGLQGISEFQGLSRVLRDIRVFKKYL